jgi:hypothetical protein
LDAVRIIQHLEGSLGARTDLTLAERMARVALDLYHATVDDPSQDTAAGRTYATD